MLIFLCQRKEISIQIELLLMFEWHLRFCLDPGLNSKTNLQF